MTICGKSLVAMVMVAFAALAAPAADTTSAPATPALGAVGQKNEQGLMAVIVVNKEKYTLDPAQSGKAFKDSLDQRNARGGRGGGRLPQPPAVDLTLRITNTSAAPVTIRVGGDDSQIQLKLQGEGAVTVDNLVAMTMEFRIGKDVTIDAGKSYDVKIESLAFGTRGISQHAYWTEAGDYTLSATLLYGFGEGQGKVTSGEAKLKVEKAAEGK